MADGDISLRNPGLSAGDINLADAPTGAFVVAFAFSGTLHDASGLNGSFTVQFDFTGELEDATAQVASLKGEVVSNLGEPASVASLREEVITNIEEDATVASLRHEVMASIFDDATIASIRHEAVAARPLLPYSPYVIHTGGGSGGLCTPFSIPTSGFGDSTSCCDGFGIPACTSGGGTTQRVLLSFQKATDDSVLLCTRGAFPGYYPTDGLSLFTWIRVTEFNGGAAGAVPMLGGITGSLGWALQLGGTGADDAVSITYRDTGSTLRSDTHTFSGGDLRTAGWRSAGGFRASATPWAQRAFVDEEVSAGTNGTVAPQAGETGQITLFGQSGGTYFTGQLLCPVVINADLGSDGTDTYQDGYYADLGQRAYGAVYDNPLIMLSPRAKNTVAPGDPVEVWAVDSGNGRVTGPTVWGTPAYWRGPWWGLVFADIHWIQVPWANSSVASGKTLVVGLQGSSTPGSNQYVVGRMAAGAGGVELYIGTSDGVDATAVLYDAAGGAVATMSVTTTEALGALYYYVIRIGAAGTASCSLEIVTPAGTVVATSSATPSSAVALNQDQRWGRAHGGSAYTAGTCYRWAECDGVLTTEEVEELLDGTLAADGHDIRGVDGNVIDDANQIKLWGPYDASGVYASTITFESIGSDAVIVGS